MSFTEEQIKRNIAARVFIEKSMGKDISDESCLDMLEKAGKPAQLGEVRTWDGKEYIKTPKGWRPKPKGFKEGEKKETTPKGNPVMKPEKVTPKNVTDKLKVGDHVMYNGKEMILTRISKDGRFHNGIEMKFAKEGETTPTGSKMKVGNMMYAAPVNKASGLMNNEVVSDFVKKELPRYNKNLDDDNKISVREFKNLIKQAHDLHMDGEKTPIDDVLSGREKLSSSHLIKLMDYFWDDFVD